MGRILKLFTLIEWSTSLPGKNIPTDHQALLKMTSIDDELFMQNGWPM